MEAVRTAEGHQIAVRIVRLRADGSHQDPTEGKSFGGSPSMPAEAPFGIVHLGETFASSLLITNEGVAAVQQVRLKIELQTTSQRSLLNETGECPLEAGETLTCQTLHDIREIGVHVIVASVHYANPITNEKKFFRKFFKFTVINPLTLKTKITEQPEMLLLEAQIQNVSGSTFVLESVLFEPGEGISCHRINALQRASIPLALETSLERVLQISNAPAEYTEEDVPNLPSECMYQYVFVVKWMELVPRAFHGDSNGITNSGSTNSSGSIHGTGNLPLGRLDIRWRREGGERGRLQTGILTHHWECKGAVRVLVREAPSRTLLHCPFEALFILQNGSGRNLDNVHIRWDCPPESTPPMAPLGPQVIHLGTLTALNSARAKMRILPLLPGLQRFHQHFYVVYSDGSELVQVPVNFSLLIETHSAIHTSTHKHAEKSSPTSVQ